MSSKLNWVGVNRLNQMHMSGSSLQAEQALSPSYSTSHKQLLVQSHQKSDEAILRFIKTIGKIGKILAQHPNTIFTVEQLGIKSTSLFNQRVVKGSRFSEYRTIYLQSGIPNTHTHSWSGNGIFIPNDQLTSYLSQQRSKSNCRNTHIDDVVYADILVELDKMQEGNQFTRHDISHIAKGELRQKSILKKFVDSGHLATSRNGNKGYIYHRTSLPLIDD
jgi:hypothetical protein